ncbi:MAG: tetratricopeptide repeat protein [Bacteroidales bacterium]|nr:tetratricopeptide repeat protein [Bacteroidales bacterium]
MKEEFEDIFHDEEYSELVNRYEEMVKRKTKYFFDVSEFENIIDYYIDTNKANNALDVVKFASQQHPGSVSLELKKAQVFVDKGYVSRALQVIEYVEKIEYTNSDVFLIKGSALNISGHYKEAEKAFDTAIDLTIDDKIDVIHTVAQSFEQIGQYKTALKYLHNAFDLDSSNIMLLYDIGYCYEKLGQINRSIEYYKQYLDKEPFSENGWYNLGILYNKNENYTKAIDAYDFAIAINPDFSVAYFNLANSYSNKEDFHSAILNYKEYLKFDGKSVEILTYIGDCYDGLKEYDTALKYYDQALTEDNFYSDAIYGKANVMFRVGKSAQALPLVENAIVIDDLNPEYYFLLGNVNVDLNNWKKAIVAYKKAVDIDPEELDFVVALSEAYVKNKEYIKAINTLTEFSKDHSGNATICFKLAACYLLDKKPKKSLETFETGLKLDPKKYQEAVTIFPEIIENKSINKLLNKYYLD